jgi:hypothetical protein
MLHVTPHVTLCATPHVTPHATPHVTPHVKKISLQTNYFLKFQFCLKSRKWQKRFGSEIQLVLHSKSPMYQASLTDKGIRMTVTVASGVRNTCEPPNALLNLVGKTGWLNLLVIIFRNICWPSTGSGSSGSGFGE